MNKDAIKRTAICHYDKKEKVYIVQSPLFDRVIGAARTVKEAQQIFDELLQDTYIAYLEGRLAGYEKPGRPPKNRIDIHAQVKPETKKLVKKLAGGYGISQGEFIDFVVSEHLYREDYK